MPSFKFGLPLAPCNLVSFVYESPLCLPPFLAAVSPFLSSFDFLPFHVLGAFCLCVCYISDSGWGAPNSVCRSGWSIALHFPSVSSLFASRPTLISRRAPTLLLAPLDKHPCAQSWFVSLHFCGGASDVEDLSDTFENTHLSVE